MSPTAIAHPDTFPTERWLISGDWFQHLLMTEAEDGLCLCKSEDLQGSNNNVWILWLLKFPFSIFISYILARSQGIHLNGEPRKQWSSVGKILRTQRMFVLSKLCSMIMEKVPQKCKEAICRWKHWMKWTKGKLASKNDDSIFHLIAQCCQMALHTRIGQNMCEMTPYVWVEQWCWILTFNYVHSLSHEINFSNSCSRGGQQKD